MTMTAGKKHRIICGEHLPIIERERRRRQYCITSHESVCERHQQQQEEEILHTAIMMTRSMSTDAAVVAKVFRQIAHSRRSTKRFEAGRTIPPETLQDILRSTLVRYALLYCARASQMRMLYVSPRPPGVRPSASTEAMKSNVGFLRTMLCYRYYYFWSPFY